MNVEKTIEFILKAQAASEIRMETFEKQMDGIRKLLKQGMRMVVKTNSNLAELSSAQKRTDARLSRLDVKLAELADAHKATERSLKAFINSLRRGSNGRG